MRCHLPEQGKITLLDNKPMQLTLQGETLARNSRPRPGRCILKVPAMKAHKHIKETTQRQRHKHMKKEEEIFNSFPFISNRRYFKTRVGQPLTHF
jgi:hypothetical protein